MYKFGRMAIYFMLVFIFFILIGLSAECDIKMEVTKENVRVINRFEELWNTGNMAIAADIFDDDFVNHSPGNTEVGNIEILKELVTEIRTGFPDFRVTSDDLIPVEDKVAIRWTANATHQGEFMGIPATGKQISWVGIVMAHFADGKIMEMWWSEDHLGMLQQLGVIPPMPDSPAPLQRTNLEECAWGPCSKVTGNPGAPERNKAIVLYEEYEGWVKGNLDATLEAISSDFVNHDPIWPEITNYDSYREYIAFDFEPINLRVDELIAEGDKVAERWVIDMGEGVTLSGMSIHRFADGKIVERWWSKDLLEMLQQEGVIPSLE